jgi:hypothetical protein
MTTHGDRTSRLQAASPLILLLALLGIPAAGCVAVVFALQIPRFIYGQAAPLFLAAEVGSLLTVLVLVVVLRVCLALPSSPRGLYRDVLDFLAVARWHPAVKATLVGLMVLPGAWILHAEYFWLAPLLRMLGTRALRSGDFQTGLDTIAVVYQLALTGGVPLLFILHMLSRRKPGNSFLPWLLVPVVFVGAAVGVVLIVATVHH